MRDNIQLTPEILFQIYTESNQIKIINNGVKDNRAPYLKAQKC